MHLTRMIIQMTTMMMTAAVSRMEIVATMMTAMQLIKRTDGLLAQTLRSKRTTFRSVMNLNMMSTLQIQSADSASVTSKVRLNKTKTIKTRREHAQAHFNAPTPHNMFYVIAAIVLCLTEGRTALLCLKLV